jgi:reverse transcriptase-like protein
MFQGDFVELRQSLGAWEASGKFTASAYNLMHRRKFPQVYDQPNQPRERLFRAIWKGFIPPKFSFIAWLALLGRLHTKDRYREGEDEPTDRICSLCHLEFETNSHLFFECEFTRTIWDRVRLWIGLRRRTTSIQSSEKCTTSIRKKLGPLALITAVDHIWKERNRVVMEGKQPSSARAYKLIVDDCYMVLNRIFPEENLY